MLLFNLLENDVLRTIHVNRGVPDSVGHLALLVQQIVQNPMLNGTTIRLDGALRMAAK